MPMIRKLTPITVNEIGPKGVVKVTPLDPDEPIQKGLWGADLVCGTCGRIPVEGLGMDLC